MTNEFLDANVHDEDTFVELSLRPQTLKQYIGQDKVKEQLEIFIEAAKIREESLDHVFIIWTSRSW